MANHKSAMKRARQNIKRNERNRQQRSRLKTTLKHLEEAISEKNAEEAQNRLMATVRLLDKSASKGLIHRNKAARKKSNLTKKVNQLAAEAP
ncbi:MAG: 30S ribosomal protein S20 [bacterium]|nr:30S ribosomal protein S20 [bacterium]